MKKIIRLTESDLVRIVKRIVNESEDEVYDDNEPKSNSGRLRMDMPSPQMSRANIKPRRSYDDLEDRFTLTKQSLKDVDYYMEQSEYLDSLNNLPIGHRWRSKKYPFEEIIKFVIDCFSKKEDMARGVVDGWQAPFKKGLENWRISNWEVVFATFYRKLYGEDAECVKQNPDWDIVESDEFQKSIEL